MADEEEKLVVESEENAKGGEVKEELTPNAIGDKKEDTNKPEINTSNLNQTTTISSRNASAATDPVVQPLLTGRCYKNFILSTNVCI